LALARQAGRKMPLDERALIAFKLPGGVPRQQCLGLVVRVGRGFRHRSA
jgi:hypothetical protein